MDPRTRKLAQLVVRKCIKAKPNENIIIKGNAEAIPFLTELYKEIILQKANPIVQISLPDTSDFFYKYATKEQIENFPDYWFDTVKQAKGYVRVDTETNTRELTNCDSKKMTTREKTNQKIRDYITDKLKWTVAAYPCLALAQDAEMSLTEYENFVYSACLQDWTKLEKIMKNILSKFKENSKVHLIGENVDLKFLVHGKKAKNDLDFNNMPAGEVSMAPIRESLNGWIKFEYPSIRNGKEMTDIFLKFLNGKVIESKTSKNEDYLKQILNTDENSSYVVDGKIIQENSEWKL